MADWRSELKQGLSEAEDQRIPMEEHPVYPLIVAALEEVKQELLQYGIWAVAEGSHKGIGGKLTILTPDISDLRMFVVVRGQTINFSATHLHFSEGFFPFVQREIEVDGVTKDLIASEIVEMYLTYLRTPPDEPKVTPAWLLREREGRRRKARRS